MTFINGARRLAAASAVVVATIGVAACGSSSDSGSSTASKSAGSSTTANDKPVNVAYFGPAGNGGLEAQMVGAKKVAEKTGNNVTLVDTGFDPPKEIAAINDALVTNKYDAMVILPLDARSIQPSIKKAVQQGMKVVTANLPADPANYYSAKPSVPGISGTVEYPFFDQGTEIAGLMVEACAGKNPCKVGYIPGLLTLPNDQITIEAIKKTLAKHPEIQFIQGSEGEYAAGPALKASQDLLTAHPDLDVIGTAGDQMTVPAERAVDSAGKKDQVKLVSIGASTQGVQAVRDGKWYGTVVDLLEDTGAYAMQMAVDAAQGKPIPKPGLVPEKESTLPRVITQENLDKFEGFKGQWAG